jgi:hypothetical protein
MLHVMSDRFELSPVAAVDPAMARVATWRRGADALRLQADEVAALAHDLSAHHRPDVWQGAVATRFGDDLEYWRTRLGLDRDDGLGAELVALAARLDARALAAEHVAAGALSDLWDRSPVPPSSVGH